MRGRFLLVLCVALCAGCAVGPKYRRPGYPAPPAYRDAPQQQGAQSFGDLKWFEVFRDETLQALIREALERGYDVRIAAQRVLVAREQVVITRSPIFPQLDGSGSESRQSGLSPNTNSSFGGGAVSWEIDLWGRIRKATEAARADYFAQEEVRKGVVQTLVTDIASGYFSLLQLDQALSATRASLDSRRISLRLVQARLGGGVSNKVEADQANTLVETAAAQVVDLERAVTQTENALCLLLGRNPAPIQRPKPLAGQSFAGVEVPAGLPSSLLDRRPDIRLAEQFLIAANARVGVAKAAFFPSISLTANGGYQSSEISGMLSNSATMLNYGGGISLPVFNAGRLWANYKASKFTREAALLSYQQSILAAFRDVSDALIGYAKTKEFLQHQEELVKTLRDQVRLSNLRYRGGVTSYLEVLDTERQALNAEVQYADAYRAELDAVVRLYKSLGGGWQ